MTDSPIGRRVEAWIGPKTGARGTVVRVDGLTRSEVRWDDGDDDWYRTADLIRVEGEAPRGPAVGGNVAGRHPLYGYVEGPVTAATQTMTTIRVDRAPDQPDIVDRLLTTDRWRLVPCDRTVTGEDREDEGR